MHAVNREFAYIDFDDERFENGILWWHRRAHRGIGVRESVISQKLSPIPAKCAEINVFYSI